MQQTQQTQQMQNEQQTQQTQHTSLVDLYAKANQELSAVEIRCAKYKRLFEESITECSILEVDLNECNELNGELITEMLELKKVSENVQKDWALEREKFEKEVAYLKAQNAELTTEVAKVREKNNVLEKEKNMLKIEMQARSLLEISDSFNSVENTIYQDKNTVQGTISSIRDCKERSQYLMVLDSELYPEAHEVGHRIFHMLNTATNEEIFKNYDMIKSLLDQTYSKL